MEDTSSYGLNLYIRVFRWQHFLKEILKNEFHFSNSIKNVFEIRDYITNVLSSALPWFTESQDF